MCSKTVSSDIEYQCSLRNQALCPKFRTTPLKVGYGIRFFGHFCKITWNPYHNPLTATELEVLTWKLNKSIICGTGRARKTPANDFHSHRVALDSKYVNQTVVLHSPSPSPAPRAWPLCAHTQSLWPRASFCLLLSCGSAWMIARPWTWNGWSQSQRWRRPFELCVFKICWRFANPIPNLQGLGERGIWASECLYG